MSTLRTALAGITAALIICCCQAVSYAGAVQLTTPGQLNPADATATYPTSGIPIPNSGASLVSNPLVVNAGGNTLTFSKPSGSFIINSFFGAGTLYTGNSFGQGTGPITITFATGVTEAGFQALANFANVPGFAFTFTALNGATAIGTFSVTTFNAGSSVFLGVRATGGDVITSIVVNHTIPDFAIGPVTFGPGAAATPEPATLLLLGTGLTGAVGAVRRRRKTQA